MRNALEFLKDSGFAKQWIEEEGNVAVLVLGNYGSLDETGEELINELMEEFPDEDGIIEWAVAGGDDMPNAVCFESEFDKELLSDKAKELFKKLAGLEMFKEERSDEESEE